MDDSERVDGERSRRRVLATAGLAGASALAGCLGGSEIDADDSSGDGDADVVDGEDAGAGEGACADVIGTSRPYDPRDRPFVFVFDYPDTWETYNEGLGTDERSVDAFLGHVGAATGASYPMNVYLNQGVPPLDASTIAEWLTPPFTDHEVVGALEYDGEQLDLSHAVLDDGQEEWRVGVPSSEGYHRVQVMATAASDYLPCSASVMTVATSVLESMRPNPDYVG